VRQIGGGRCDTCGRLVNCFDLGVYVCICVYMCVCVRVNVCMCVNMCVYACIYVYMSVYLCDTCGRLGRD